MKSSSRPRTYKLSSRGCLKAMVYVLASAGIMALLVVAGVIILQVIVLTTPGRNQDIGSLGDLPSQDITLTTADGLHLSGWYVPGPRPEAIILVHGIHANRAYLLPQAFLLAQAGYPLLLLDLRGHGRSEGREVTYGYREALDVEAAVDYLAARPEIKHIGALGHSLGGAALVRAAATDPRLEALVIQSSFSSLARVVDDSFNTFVLLPKWPFAPLVITLAELKTGVSLDQVDSARDLAAMPPRPVLFIHSADDGLFPIHHAQQMYDAARNPKEFYFVSGLGHVNPISGREAEYSARVLKFFETAFAR
ncbi:MAG: alpha/beta fold hydrolase [Anaerolineales bacterium]|nr:alpha/beta fold hydrolase [Anaerolineales bacterium]